MNKSPLYVCGSNGDESLSIGGCYLLNEAYANNQALHHLYLGFDSADEINGVDNIVEDCGKFVDLAVSDSVFFSSSTQPSLDTLKVADDSSANSRVSLSSLMDKAINIVTNEVIYLLQTGCCIDEHTCDQLLLYMALAKGTSRVLCAPTCHGSSLHIETVIKVVSDMTGVQFSIEELETNGEVDALKHVCRLITCEGHDIHS